MGRLFGSLPSGSPGRDAAPQDPDSGLSHWQRLLCEATVWHRFADANNIGFRTFAKAAFQLPMATRVLHQRNRHVAKTKPNAIFVVETTPRGRSAGLRPVSLVRGEPARFG